MLPPHLTNFVFKLRTMTRGLQSYSSVGFGNCLVLDVPTLKILFPVVAGIYLPEHGPEF